MFRKRKPDYREMKEYIDTVHKKCLAVIDSVDREEQVLPAANYLDLAIDTMKRKTGDSSFQITEEIYARATDLNEKLLTKAKIYCNFA